MPACYSGQFGKAQFYRLMRLQRVGPSRHLPACCRSEGCPGSGPSLVASIARLTGRPRMSGAEHKRKAQGEPVSHAAHDGCNALSTGGDSPPAAHDGEVGLLHLSVRERRAQGGKGRPRFRDHDQPARRLIQAVHLPACKTGVTLPGPPPLKSSCGLSPPRDCHSKSRTGA